MKLYIPLSLLVGLFIFLKLTSLGVRVSDTNVYFYTAYEMLQGKSLYKDIFFTNFPLFMYISSLYITLTGGNIYLYYFTAVIEVAVTATIIHLIVRDKTEKVLPSTLASSIYLFSYLILATSDHQTGVFLGSVFAVLSYYFYTKKKYFLTGGFVALMILTKAYFLPVALSYFFILPLSLRSFKKPLVQFLLGGAVIGSIILLPTLLTSFSEFYRDIVEYSLIRPQGISKTAIFTALLQREFLFVLLWGISIFLIKK